MKDWLALRPLAAALAILSAILLAMAGLINAGKADMLIPSPEGVAEQLAGAIGAQRSTGAHNQLSTQLQHQLTEDDLLQLARAIEAGPLQGIADAHALDAHTAGDQATARVAVKFNNLTTQTLEFALVRENGLWKVSSLEALQSLPKSNLIP